MDNFTLYKLWWCLLPKLKHLEPRFFLKKISQFIDIYNFYYYHFAIFFSRILGFKNQKSKISHKFWGPQSNILIFAYFLGIGLRHHLRQKVDMAPFLFKIIRWRNDVGWHPISVGGEEEKENFPIFAGKCCMSVSGWKRKIRKFEISLLLLLSTFDLTCQTWRRRFLPSSSPLLFTHRAKVRMEMEKEEEEGEEGGLISGVSLSRCRHLLQQKKRRGVRRIPPFVFQRAKRGRKGPFLIFPHVWDRGKTPLRQREKPDNWKTLLLLARISHLYYYYYYSSLF